MTDDREPATVLVVEDEQSLADLYEAILESAYTVHTAYDGTEALESIHPDVDVVLLDRRMPGLSGEEVLREIREEGYDCRIAMITAVPPDVDIIEMGFDDYLTKPVERPKLIETVEQLLELNTCDDLVQEYYQLASTRAALMGEKTEMELSEDEQFDRLVDRLTDLEAELDDTQVTGPDSDVRSLLDRSGDRLEDG